MKYVYPAKIIAEKVGGYSVIFLDVEGAVTQGETLFDALYNAEDALAEILIAWENFKAGRTDEMLNRIAEPTDITGWGYSAEVFYTLVKADTDAYRNFREKNPDGVHECWYSPNEKKFFTMLTDDNVEVKPTVEKLLRDTAGVQ